MEANGQQQSYVLVHAPENPSPEEKRAVLMAEESTHKLSEQISPQPRDTDLEPDPPTKTHPGPELSTDTCQQESPTRTSKDQPRTEAEPSVGATEQGGATVDSHFGSQEETESMESEKDKDSQFDDGEEDDEEQANIEGAKKEEALARTLVQERANVDKKKVFTSLFSDCVFDCCCLTQAQQLQDLKRKFEYFDKKVWSDYVKSIPYLVAG